uniref:TetR/AcrR family transcriptional regulator C-terminal ligand-binding domain-containing protein n=1 Tax=Cellulomonas citrea TaxID=1909423 RepID=UPI00191532A6
VAGLLADLGADAAAREQTRDQVLRPVADALHALLVRAVRRGDLADDTPVEALVAALGGAVFLRAVVLDVPARPQDAEDLVRLLLHGAARADPR